MFDDTNTFQYLYFIMLYRIHYSLVKKGIEGFFFFFHLYKDDEIIYIVQWFVQGHSVNMIN